MNDIYIELKEVATKNNIVIFESRSARSSMCSDIIPEFRKKS